MQLFPKENNNEAAWNAFKVQYFNLATYKLKDFKNILVFFSFISQLKYSKKYQNQADEEYRKKIFMENQQKIDAHNEQYESGKSSYEMGMNEFGDLTSQEFSGKMNGFKPTNERCEKKNIFFLTFMYELFSYDSVI